MSAVLVVLPLAVLALYNAAGTIEQVNSSQEKELIDQLDLIGNRIYMTKEFADDFVMKELELLESRFRESGGLRVSTWTSLRSIGDSKKAVQVKKIVLDSEPEYPVQEVLNELTVKTRAFFTVFQPFDNGIIRTSTSIKDQYGKAVTGTYIDKTSEVYKTVIEGKTFHGRAEILGSWYSTVYKPVVSQSGNLLYVLFAGKREAAYFESLFNELAVKTIADEGYFYILDSAGNFVLSQNRQLDGENVIDMKDADGNLIISQLIESGTKNPGINIMSYSWKDDEASDEREIITAYRYIDEFGWVLGACDYTDRAHALIKKSLKMQMIIMLISLLSGLTISFVLTSFIYKSINRLQRSIGSIAGGDLVPKKAKRSFFREIYGLEKTLESEMIPAVTALIRRIDDKSRQIVKMSDVLEYNINHSLSSIKNVNKSSDRVSDESEKLNTLMLSSASSTDTIVESLNNLNNMVNEQSSSVTQISASIEEANASLQNVSRVVQEKLTNARTLEKQGEAGKKSVSETNRFITQIDIDVTVLYEINEIINEITEQSKLLAMNAAIEAAHAGNHGRGFAIVAGEMRTLAHNTAENGLRIGETIKEILGRTKEAAKQSNATAVVIDRIAEDLSLFTDAFQEIANSTDEISAGTSQILSAANLLSEMSGDTLTESRIINDSAMLLADAVKVTTESSEKNQAETTVLKNHMNELTDVQNEMKNLGYLNVLIGEELSDALTTFEYDDESREASIVEMIRAHQTWVERVQKHLDGSEKIDISRLGDHHDCALGNWLDSHFAEKLEMRETYDELLVSHEELHVIVRKMIEEENAEDLISFQKLKKLSHEVIQNLLALLLN